jgi:poly(3-hydroxybutyrate) depolymerase
MGRRRIRFVSGALQLFSPLVLALLVVVLALGCDGADEPASRHAVGEPETHIEARPSRGRGNRCTQGEHELRIEPGRRAIMRVTRPGNRRDRALLLALHGAGSGGAPGGLWAFRSAWNLPGLVLVAPSAAGSAWTLDERDIGFVERALRAAFARCAIAPRLVAVGGFSSGAGLALWIGLTNGDLFRHVITLSPGGALPTGRVGKPRILLAHGTNDSVIPISAGGDRVAHELRSDGYAVTYRRFRGGHRPRPEIVRAFVASSIRR